MKASSLKELRDELKIYPPEQLQSLCIRLVTFKKENKALLTYFMFAADNEQGYIDSVKEEID
nr:hypothetical protein [Sunxiuqinia sp.]